MSKRHWSHTSPSAAPSSAERDWSRISAQLLAGVAIVALIVLGINLGRPSAPPPDDAGPTMEATDLPFEVETPEPYYYDETNNRWWHEEAGRGHWHPGQPPPPDERE